MLAYNVHLGYNCAAFEVSAQSKRTNHIKGNIFSITISETTLNSRVFAKQKKSTTHRNQISLLNQWCQNNRRMLKLNVIKFRPRIEFQRGKKDPNQSAWLHSLGIELTIFSFPLLVSKGGRRCKPRSKFKFQIYVPYDPIYEYMITRNWKTPLGSCARHQIDVLQN